MPTGKVCLIANCGKAHYAKGYCSRHWSIAHKHGDPLYKRPPAPATCTAEGCGKPHAYGGYCQAHYLKIRRTGKIYKSRREEVQDFFEATVKSDSTECIWWPFGRKKDKKKEYGFFMHKGKTRSAHRFMCMLAHGEPAKPELEAAHLCGNPSCVNPNHLKWKTKLENQADRLVHGTDCRGVKSCNTNLTEEDVRAIRELARHGTPHKVIAMRFGKSLGGLRSIIYRITWKHVD